jgi:CMP-N-acetylneuraminic acid synthetase
MCKIKSLLKYKSLYRGKIKKIEMNYYQSIDIDTKFDYEIAKLIYKKKLFN